MIQLLLDRGADINKVTVIKEYNSKSKQMELSFLTPLFIAMVENRYNLAIYLLKHGANPIIEPRVKYYLDWTEIHRGIHNKKLAKLVKLLVRKGMDVNSMIQSADFDVPLLVLAIDLDDVNLAKFLLENGANTNVIFDNKSVLQRAKDHGNPGMIALLETYGMAEVLGRFFAKQ